MLDHLFCQKAIGYDSQVLEIEKYIIAIKMNPTENTTLKQLSRADKPSRDFDHFYAPNSEFACLSKRIMSKM